MALDPYLRAEALLGPESYGSSLPGLIGMLCDVLEKSAPDAVVAAWLLDRAEQYGNDTCCRAVFDELMQGAAEGAHRAAFAHGELDDLMQSRFIVDAAKAGG